jgi:hypothetical protein
MGRAFISKVRPITVSPVRSSMGRAFVRFQRVAMLAVRLVPVQVYKLLENSLAKRYETIIWYSAGHVREYVQAYASRLYDSL